MDNDSVDINNVFGRVLCCIDNLERKSKVWWKFLFPIEMFLAQWVSPIKRRLEHRGQKFKWDKITTVGFVAGLLCQMSKLAAISEL